MTEVYVLSHGELRDLMWNLTLSRHARMRLVERFGLHPKSDVTALYTPVLNYGFAYMNTDGYINVGISDDEYLVVAPREHDYLCITYKEKSNNGYTIKDKYQLALKGVER